MALLYETVTSFEDLWLECLGDLARYRMAIGSSDSDREIWCGIARAWYHKTTDKNRLLAVFITILGGPGKAVQLATAGILHQIAHEYQASGQCA